MDPSASKVVSVLPVVLAVSSLLRFKEKATAQKKQVIVPIRKSYSINDWIKVAAVFLGVPLMIWFFTVQIHTKGNDELTASTSRSRRSCAPHRPAECSQRGRSEEHTSELQSQLTISYAVFCFKKIFFF